MNKDDIYQLWKPPLYIKEAYQHLAEKPKTLELTTALKKANSPYLYWDELRYKTWIPEDYSANKELFWTLVKINRQLYSSITPVRDVKGNFFRLNLHAYSEFLHTIDKEMAGSFMGIHDLSETDKKQFISHNIIEEAIASSQLEGANTSRAVAKKMIQEGRAPRNIDERMIINTHTTMMHIEKTLYKEELSWELICNLHSMITYQTLEEQQQGKLRETYDSKGIKLMVKLKDGKIAYIAPDKEFVEQQLPKLIYFANDKNEQEFIHPLIKAIILHFWIGFLHPFEDGNGRLARILFYWYMLKNDYWAFAYLSLSEKIKKSAQQYAMAYIYSEQDDYDLTYFVDYNINKLKLAREDFQRYILKKTHENRLITATVQKQYNLNERQIKLLHYFDKNIENHTNLISYQNLYFVAKRTAINDLKQLVDQNYVTKRKVGRNIFYYPTEKIKTLFK